MTEPSVGLLRRLLRRPWSLLVVKAVVVIAPLALLVDLVHRMWHLPTLTAQHFVEAPAALLSLALFALYTQAIEGRRVNELLLRPAPCELLAGFALGFLAISLTVAVLAALGHYRITGHNPWSAALVPLWSAIGAATFEELLFRGVMFRITEDWLGSYWALALSAVLFGAAHLSNPHATLLAGVAIMIEAGAVLSPAYMLRRRLWFPIGIHAGWNFTEEGLGGLPNSGSTPYGLIQATLHGPAWLTGGDFGAEASAVGVVIAGAVGLLLLREVVRRGAILAPCWRREPRRPAHV
jgi:uncharacterized protein